MTRSNRHSGFEVQGCAQAKDASSSPEFEYTSHEVLCAGRVATTLPLSLCWSRPSRRCAKPTSKSLLYTAGFPKWSAESHQKWIPTTFPTTLTPSSSVMLWRGIMGFTKFDDKRVNDLALLSGYVVGVACLHRENPCRRICMQLAPRTSWSSVLYLSFLFAMLCSFSFCCIFICTNPKQTVLMSARSSFHWGMSTFFVTPSMCCVFICTNSRHTLKTSLCCAFY